MVYRNRCLNKILDSEMMKCCVNLFLFFINICIYGFQSAVYRHKFGPNYHATFEVKINLDAAIIPLELRGPDELVWEQEIDLKGTLILL